MGYTQAVFAIDPGSEQSAFVIWDGQGISRKGKYDNGYILHQIELCSDVYEKLVIEMVASYGMPVGKEVFDTCVWIGRFVQTGFVFGKDAELIFRRAVKTHLCQDSRAKDSNIRQALIDRFGPIGTTKKPNLVYGESFHKGDKIKADVWQAFALAVTWWDLQTHGNSR